LCLGTALTIIDGSIVNVALPSISRDLGTSAQQSVLIVTVYNLVLVMTLLPFAAMSDRIRVKRSYQIGQAVFTGATALCFLARDLSTLLAIRALQALGGAASLSVMSALIRAIYPSDKLGKGLAINTFTVAIASAVAPTVGGLILSVASWPWLFAAGVPFALLSMVLGWRALPESPRHEGGHPPDFVGAALCIATFGVLFGSLQLAGHEGYRAAAMMLMAFGILIGVFFVRYERRQPHPVMPVDLLRSARFSASLTAAFAFFMAMTIIVISLPFRLEAGARISPAKVGLILSAWPITTMILSPIVGQMADRFEGERLGALGMIVTALGMALLTWLPDQPGYWDVAWRMALSAVGSSIFMVPNTKLIIAAAPGHRSAAAGGLQSTVRLMAQTFAALIVAGLLADGRTDGEPALIATGLAIGAALVALLRTSAPAKAVPLR